MNDKQLYHQILGIHDPWTVTDVQMDLAAKEMQINVEYDNDIPAKCPQCGVLCSKHDHKKRRWRHLDTCQLKTIICCEVPRASCPKHGIHQVSVPWAENNSRFSSLFEALAINWLKQSNIKAVAQLLNISWDEASGIQERAVRRGMRRRKLKPSKNIGIDETAFQKNHEYVTVVLDRDTDTVIDVLDDRKAKTLENWLKRRPRGHNENIESITMDMWAPYICAVEGSIPNAKELICFDKFHVIQYFNKAVDKVRLKEHKNFLKEKGYSSLVGTKYDWLKSSKKIDNRIRRDFMLLTKLKLKTARAWAIKETASGLWDYIYRAVADKNWRLLLRWISKCRLDPIIKVGKMIRRYLWGILNAIMAKASNAMLEAKNSRIQYIKKVACGFRNRKRFRDAILFHLGGLDMMPKGVIL